MPNYLHFKYGPHLAHNAFQFSPQWPVAFVAIEIRVRVVSIPAIDSDYLTISKAMCSYS